MKITLLTVCVVYFIGTLCQKSSGDFESARAVQIITPVNHTFQLELNDFKAILEADDIKDRHVVVVSIAGAFRKGKSFLSNFFIRYLYAQYKVHNVTDWLGESENSSKLDGFKWRGGQKPETTGIWMWSDIFTHDYENGEKVAIILLDTQGIFDSRSSVRDCTTIFTLSMMLSSVQCYNVMQNIQENDLQHLELFTEYGRMVLNQTNEKPFQYLLFIVRDWPFADENNYGWGQGVVDTLLTGDEEQTQEMHQLRQRINSSFEEIGAFLLPYPGSVVALKKIFTGDLKQIDPEFIKYVKELVPSIFAPENLVLKRINGEKVRARDLVEYLKAYLKVFNGNSLPEPKTVYGATAEASNLILFYDAVDLYNKLMETAIREVDPYFNATELLQTHEIAKNQSIAQFMQRSKLGSDDLISSFIHRIENATEERFLDFKKVNNDKKKIFTDKANLHNSELVMKIRTDCEKKMLNGIEYMESITYENLMRLLNNTKNSSVDMFNANKMGDDDITSSFAEKLQEQFEYFQFAIETNLALYKDSLNYYSNSMRNELDKIESYAKPNSLMETHQNARKDAIEQFQLRSNGTAVEWMSAFQRRIEKEIETKFILTKQENEEKRDIFIANVMVHNENLVEVIKSDVENDAYSEVSGSDSYLDDYEVWSLWFKTKKTALNKYDLNKMGDDDISSGYRTQLDNLMDDFQLRLKSQNANKKSLYIASKVAKSSAAAAAAGSVGAVILGPVGGVIGFISGGIIGYIS